MSVNKASRRSARLAAKNTKLQSTSSLKPQDDNTIYIPDDSSNLLSPTSQDTKDTIKYLSKCARDKSKTGWLKYAHVSNKDYLKWLCTDSIIGPAPIPKTHIRSFDVCAKSNRNVHKYLSKKCHGLGQTFIEKLTPTMKSSVVTASLKNPSANVYTWTDNNCWIDSVLMIILMGKSSHIRDVIFKSDPSKTSYGLLESLGYIKSLCNTGYKLTPLIYKDWAKRFQQSLKKDYETLLSDPNKEVFCTNTKRIISKCITKNPSGFGGVQEFYTMVTYMFPRLLIPIETTRKRLDLELIKKFQTVYTETKTKKYVPMLAVDSFIGWVDVVGKVSILNNPTKVVVSKYTNKLVDSSSVDSSSVDSSSVVVFFLDTWFEYKSRIAGGKAIDLRSSKDLFGSIGKKGYELYATVVSLPGHWISYFKPFDNPDKWMYYNDMGKDYKEVDFNNPNEAAPWMSTIFHYVTMMFFCKTKKSKSI